MAPFCLRLLVGKDHAFVLFFKSFGSNFFGVNTAREATLPVKAGAETDLIETEVSVASSCFMILLNLPPPPDRKSRRCLTSRYASAVLTIRRARAACCAACVISATRS